MRPHVAVSEGRAVEVKGEQPLCVALVGHTVEAELVAHVGGLPRPQQPPRGRHQGPVLPTHILRPVVSEQHCIVYLYQLVTRYFH